MVSNLHQTKAANLFRILLLMTIPQLGQPLLEVFLTGRNSAAILTQLLLPLLSPLTSNTLLTVRTFFVGKILLKE